LCVQTINHVTEWKKCTHAQFEKKKKKKEKEYKFCTQDTWIVYYNASKMVTVTTHSIKHVSLHCWLCTRHKRHMSTHGSSEWDIIFHLSSHELTFSFLSVSHICGGNNPRELFHHCMWGINWMSGNFRKCVRLGYNRCIKRTKICCTMQFSCFSGHEIL
jgi:hypothetical protein